MNIGIDKISLYTPEFFLDMETLAQKRGESPQKYFIGLGQKKMSVLPPDQDIITMGVAAAKNIIDDDNSGDIDLVIFATESGLDYSKAAGIYVHDFLDLPTSCRTIEIKQACYSSTAAVRFAIHHIRSHPTSRALIIASDNARYGLNTPGEATQGCGAVAMIISVDPSIVSINDEAGFLTENVMDFWRPSYKDEAIVDGKHSARQYFKNLLNTWEVYKGKTGYGIQDHDHYLFHLPFSKMAEKGLKKLCDREGADYSPDSIQSAIRYNEIIGNSYTASLYISLISLLENTDKDLSGQRIGLYAYGSGCVAEFFSGQIVHGYKDSLPTNQHERMFDNRKQINYATYQRFYRAKGASASNGNQTYEQVSKNSPITLIKMDQHKRIYDTG
jgi:hydroxymethylglutaryl-CoA synthase